MAIPVLVITGFLGGGKTSFLRHLLPQCGAMGLRPALVINEVGDVDVDGALLADLHAEQARLVGGCVCCTLQAQLSQTMFDLVERRVADVILIECSGLSNPIDVLSALGSPALVREVTVTHVVCLLDSVKAPKVMQVAELAKEQVKTADVVILNKQDRVEDHAAVDTLVATLAPHARQYRARYGDIGEQALAALLAPAPARTGGRGQRHGARHHTHALPASFCTVAVPLPRLSRPAVEALLRALPENVLRVKGFAHLIDEGWAILHRVFDQSEIAPFTGPAPTAGAVLICIGQHLDAESILEMVHGLSPTATP